MRIAGLGFLVIVGSLVPCVAAEAKGDPWEAYRFLIGEWTGEGEGQGGQGKGGFTLVPDLGGNVLIRRNHVDVAADPTRPLASHEDLMVIYPAENGQPHRAIYFDNEGHVIHYTVQPSEDHKSLIFLSDASPRTPRFRLTYSQKDEERIAITFAIAPLAKPDEFKTYLEGTARRRPRSNVGLSLPKGYIAYRAPEPISIDGKLDEKAWQVVPWSEPFVDIEGDLKPLPRFQTRVKMLWDDQFFYVGANLAEPHVWGTLTQHDAVIFQDNDFEIFIDPDGDNHEYYEIEINALNTEWDLFLKKPYRDGGPALNSWEIPGLKTAVHVQGTLNDSRDKDQYWSVEFAIPWKVLAEYSHRPAPPRDGDQWRINFSRVEWQHEIEGNKYRKVPNTKEDNWVWSPQGVIDMHRPESWGIVQFSTRDPGTDSVRPDSAVPIRDRLIDIYHAQKKFRGKNQRFADRAETLDLPPLPTRFPSHEVSITLTPAGYEAVITFEPQREGKEAWSIRQDSKIDRKSSAP
jgi:hypothetical protein